MTDKQDSQRAERLKEAFDSSGYTQAAYAQKFGVNRNTLKSNLNGNAVFGYPAAREYAVNLGVEAGWLYGTTGSEKCMHTDRFAPLEQVIADRLAAGDASSSYVASLASKGLPKVAQKVGEEAVETVIAALNEADDKLIGEAADLLFHLTLLLKLRGLGLDEVSAELARRHGASGLAEKAARPE